MKPERGKKSSLRASLRKTFKRGAKPKTAINDLVEVCELLKEGSTQKTPSKNGGFPSNVLHHTPLGTPSSKKQKLDNLRLPVTPLAVTTSKTRSQRKTEVIVVDAAIPEESLANVSGASSSSSLTLESSDVEESHLLSSTSSDLDESGEGSLSPVQKSVNEEEEDWMDGPGSRLNLSSEREPSTFSDEYRLVSLDSKSYLLLLPVGNTKLPMRGLARIRSLYNTVSVLGYDITPDLKDPVPVFCPTNVSYLSLETSQRERGELSGDERKLLLERLSDCPLASQTCEELVDEMRTDSVLLHVSKLSHAQSKYLTSFGHFKHLYTGGSAKKTLSKDEKATCLKVGLFMNPTGAQGQNIILPMDDYDAAARAITASVQHDMKAPTVLLVGPKNSGKSTALRFLVNRLLNSSTAACYLECDPGQTEFTVPAVLSLHVIKRPLLGPPFTHLREPELAFFLGDVNPADHTGNYVKMITALYQHYKERLAGMPLFVNTMGWVEGLGLTLLREIVGLIHPTHVVQLVSPDEEPVTLVPHVEDKRELHFFNISEADSDRLVLQPDQVLQIESKCQTDSYQASSHRQLNVLAALSRLHVLNPDVDQLLAIPPHTVPWSQVFLHVCHQQVPTSQLLYAANANIVALCSTSKEEMKRCCPECREGLNTFSDTPISEFIGLGIVRAIDPEKKVFYILPAVAKEMLSRVNTLLISSLSIPECIFRQQTLNMELPYLSESFDRQICGSLSVNPKTYLKRGQGARNGRI